MSIADKLTYLNETKRQLREVINAAFGAGLTETTPFREYANVEGLWNPRLLFLSGGQGAWYDPSDLSTLFQDAAGATPVTATGDPVGLMLDKSGNGNHATQATSAARPVYRTDGELHWLEFDGVDARLITTLRLTTPVSLAAGYELNNPSNTNMYILGGGYLSGAQNGYGLGFYTGQHVFQNRYNGGLQQIGVQALAHKPTVVFASVDPATNTLAMQSSNGSTSQTFPDFSSSIPADNFAIGRPDTTAALMNLSGKIFSVVLFGGVSTSEEVLPYLANKAGVTLP